MGHGCMGSKKEQVSKQFCTTFHAAKRINKLGQYEYGEFKDGKPYGKVTIYYGLQQGLKEEKVYN